MRLAPAVVLGLLTACSSGTGVAGAGEKTSLCNAVVEYNALAEPDPTARQSVLTHVDTVLRLLARVDPDQHPDGKQKPPSAVIDQVKAAAAEYTTLRSAVASASSADQLHTAVAAFARDQAFSAADTGFELWTANNCL